MAGLCDGGNEPPGSLKASKLVALLFTTLHGLQVPDRLLYVLRMRRDAVPMASDVDVTSDSRYSPCADNLYRGSRQ
ncbi:hypothetical protein ANN_26082 [Periplaneta americana]|uniref:Uncharacterized protein n=1 Tax=Periplaneta americana TaxID=6978 RepID=A0ABQ8S5D4_PERAM|nr:hypothetical protein ANN_26082 [Periplaneta americana]